LAAQCELAQRHEIAPAEEVVRRPLRLLGHVHLAGPQPFKQFLCRDIDQHHLVCIVKRGVGHGFPDAHVGDSADDVVETLQVLHVQRGEHIDAGRQQLLDVLPALRMTRTLNIRMREFVDALGLFPALFDSEPSARSRRARLTWLLTHDRRLDASTREAATALIEACEHLGVLLWPDAETA
jgi:hypothetical protein